MNLRELPAGCESFEGLEDPVKNANQELFPASGEKFVQPVLQKCVPEDE